MRLLRALWTIPGLILLNWANHFWNFWLWLGEIRAFYADWHLMQADLLWMLNYGLQSPFTLSRQALQTEALPDDLSVYGETPWTTLARIAEAAGLQAGDQVIELGCGTGRTLLFFYYALGCKVRGYELVPAFVARFERLHRQLKLGSDVQILQQNWFDADLSAGQFFLLVGTCYSDDSLRQALHCLEQIRPGAVVASVSYPLRSVAFKPVQILELPFSWGRGTVYLQEKIG